MLRRSHYLPWLTVLMFGAALFGGCGKSAEQEKHAAKASQSGPPPNAPAWFVDVAHQAGIDWRCTYGTDKTDYILETTGPGAAWADFDGDGWPDLFLLNGSHFNADTLAKYHPHAALYRNMRDGTFKDVTASSGINFVGWGGAALAFDYDNDGHEDLYIVNANGPNRLYHNLGNGTFKDVTRKAGVGDAHYGTAACAIDYNNDGLLDLFVVNYVPFNRKTAEKPGSSRYSIVRGVPMSTAPEGYAGERDILYRNNGDGTFTDVSAKAGINGVLGRGLGVTTLDYNNDGLTDIYVTNDAMQNFLYRNNGNGTFTNVAVAAGVAYGEGGIPDGSMGVTAFDLDNDGWMDIVVANYEDQTASVYMNHDGRVFIDRSVPAGIGAATLPFLQWGVVGADFNLDGAVDLYFADGHVSSRLEARYPQSTFAQRNLLFLNNGNGTFREVGAESGPGLAPILASRGAAWADYDNDGDPDIVVINKSGPVELLRNDTPRRGRHWLRIVPVGTRSSRDAVGARIRIVAGGKAQIRDVRLGSSFASTEDRRPLFGLGTADRVDSVTVRWPAGDRTDLVNVRADTTLRIVEGE